MRRSAVEPTESSLSVGDRCGNWLINLMGNRCGQMTHHRNAVRMLELKLRLVVAPLVFACFCFHSLALAQIKHKGNTFLGRRIETCHADQYRDSTPVLSEVFLLSRLHSTGHPELWDPVSFMNTAPFGWREARPMQ